MAIPRWQSTFTDEAGDVRAGISVEIRDESSGALAALFSDRAGSISKGNPATTDANGYLFFYVAPGRYRIQADDVDWRDVEITQQEDIAQKADLAGGADANFVLMPQVGGDPVVESGSNSDGEWTRWADGTQICSVMDLNPFERVAGKLYAINTDWTFPIGFTSSPVVTQTPLPAAGEWSFEQLATGRLRTVSGSLCSVQSVRYDGGDFPSDDAITTSCTATGRWK